MGLGYRKNKYIKIGLALDNINDFKFSLGSKIFLGNIEQLEKIDNIFKTNGKTDVKIFIKNHNQNLSFKLKNMKNIERKSLETLKNKGISLIIN